MDVKVGQHVLYVKFGVKSEYIVTSLVAAGFIAKPVEAPHQRMFFTQEHEADISILTDGTKAR